MKRHSEFVEFLLENLQPLGAVRARRMFGGYGVFLDDLMFALIADDTLYLKADSQNEKDFAELDLPPFVFEREDKSISMSYRLAPEFVFDDPDELVAWCRKGYLAALRARNR